MTFVRVPPDSTGKKIYHKESIQGADNVLTQVIHVGDTTDPSRTQKIDPYGAALTSYNEGQPTLDAFGSLRVSEGRILGNYEFTVSDQADLFWDPVVGTGALTHNPQTSQIVLSTGGESGASVQRISNRYHYYQTGTGMLILISGHLSDKGKTNNVRCWGYGDQENGFYFCLNGTQLGVSVRSNTSGVPVNRVVNQTEWNTDKLDGTGISGYDIDITKINLYWIDFAWLGAGSVRFGVYDGKGNRVVCHVFENANQVIGPYSKTASLPVYARNENFGVVGSTSELFITSWGVYNDSNVDYTFWRYADMETPQNVVVGSEHTNVLSVRPKLLALDGGINRVNIFPEYISVFVKTTEVRLCAYWGIDLSGTTWNIGHQDTLLEGCTGGTVVSHGTEPTLHVWYLSPGTHQICLRELFETNDEALTLNADGTTQLPLNFVASSLSETNAEVRLVLGYRELH
jgi:hypothetical protein